MWLQSAMKAHTHEVTLYAWREVECLLPASWLSQGDLPSLELLAETTPTKGEATPSQGAFRCEACGRCYKHQRNLSYHSRFECSFEGNFSRFFSCPHCKHKTKRKSNLRLHIKLKHTKLNQILPHKDQLSWATSNSSADQVFICPKCSKSYKALSSLSRHIKYECGILPQFQCRVCGKRCKQKTHLKRHMLDKHTEGIELFNCPLCSHKAKRKNQILPHKDQLSWATSNSSADQVFICPKCSKSYKVLSSLSRHIKYECGIDPQFQCRNCDKRFKQKSHLKTHMLEMHTDGIQLFYCPLCNHKAKRKSKLKLHLFRVHAEALPTLQNQILQDVGQLSWTSSVNSSEDQVFTCPKCSKSYKVLRSLNRHVRYECGIDPKFQCRICGVRCKRKGNLKRHMIDKHTEGVEWNCPLCSHTYKRKSNLKAHLIGAHTEAVAALQNFGSSVLDDEGLEEEFLSLITTSAHGDVIRFKCNRCFKSYKYRSDLTRHLKSFMSLSANFGELVLPPTSKRRAERSVTEDERYACEKCSRSYKNKGHLMRHIKYECGIEPKFKCSLWYLQFPANYDQPMNEQGGQNSMEERFACERCDRSYKHRKHLMRHLKFECGVEPRFSCSLCPHRTYHNCNMKVHIFTKHRKELDTLIPP
ncbi:hypothetical protein LSTR_LSTR000946 [Laodelphax striatellus]|uniref:C2H2-type domain-containing protein n=1 Tax=Laodelphax striatellus TaxID=195883 RepID=A0A482X0R8_LAOST|nr:hypothetical protein LSTR_LSTR000946 [Laodelphax striatellus]